MTRDRSRTDERPGDAQTVVLESWDGPWDPDDPDANYKAEIALYAHSDPLGTIENMGRAMNIPVGAIAKYVLARYATTGSGGLLEIGPTMVHRLWEPIDRAESSGTDDARLDAYDQLRQMISWLRLPLVSGAGYGDG